MMTRCIGSHCVSREGRLGLAGLSLAALLFSTACGPPHGPATERPSPKNRVRPGHAPTPFTAEEIRKACPSGHFRRYLVEVPGQPPLYRTLAFKNVTQDSADFSSAQVDSQGRPFGEQRHLRAQWKALVAHASFPKAHTTIRKVTVVTGGGLFEAWLYEVTPKGGQERERYWFALTLPGPPVQYERYVEGKLLFRMTLLGHGRPRPTPADPKEAE